MRSSRVLKASDCQCQNRNSTGFDPSILGHSGIWGAADEAVLNKVLKKSEQKKEFKNLRCRGRCWWWCRTPPPFPPPHPANMNDVTIGVEDPDPGGENSGSCIRDPGSATNIPDHISKCLVAKSWIKMLKFFVADPAGSAIFLTQDPGSGMENFGSRINIPDSQPYLQPHKSKQKNNIKTRIFRRWSKRSP